MIWRRLKNNKCPVCNRLLKERKGKKVFCALGHFFVGYKEFEEIINHLYRKKGYLIEWNQFCKEDFIKNKQ